MKTIGADGRVLSAGLLSSPLLTSIGMLSLTELLPSIVAAGQAPAWTIRFQTSTPIPSGGQVKVSFDAGWDLTHLQGVITHKPKYTQQLVICDGVVVTTASLSMAAFNPATQAFPSLSPYFLLIPTQSVLPNTWVELMVPKGNISAPRTPGSCSVPNARHNVTGRFGLLIETFDSAGALLDFSRLAQQQTDWRVHVTAFMLSL